MNATGYSVLKEIYSRPIEDDSLGLAKFIQSMYLHRLEKLRIFDRMSDDAINSMKNKESRDLCTILKGCDLPVGTTSMHVRPQPHYEESIELAQYAASLGVFIFSPTPYVILGDNKWENKNWCLMKTDLGEMPTLTKKEMDRCKQDILINYEDRGFNVIHQIYGYHTTDYINGGAISTKLCYMCCGISKEYSKKIMSAKSKSILYHCPWCSKDIKQKDGKLVQHHNLPEKRCIGSGQPITNKRIKQA